MKRISMQIYTAALATVLGLLGTVAGASASPADALPDPQHTEQLLGSGMEGSRPDKCSSTTLGSTLHLADVVDHTLCNNPQTRQVWANLRRQEADLGQSRSEYWPTLALIGGVSDTNGVSSRLQRQVGASQPGWHRETDAALELAWTLFDFGGRSARMASATSLLDGANAVILSTSQQLTLSAVEGFYTLAAAQAAVQAAQLSELTARRSLEVVTGRFDAGTSTRADVLQAQTAGDQATLARVRSEGDSSSARGQLAVIMGEPATSTFGVMADPFPADVPALQQRVEALMEDAELQRPDLRAARDQWRASLADVDAARASGRPVIALKMSESYFDPVRIPPQHYATIGLSVNMPLFSGFSTAYRVRAAQTQAESLNAGIDSLRLRISFDVWSAYTALRTAAEQLKATAALRESAAENERVALGRLRAGVGTVIDALTAQSAAAIARQQRIEAELAWQVGRARLAAATGHLAFENTAAVPAGAITPAPGGER
jgi:outer membrane protein